MSFAAAIFLKPPTDWTVVNEILPGSHIAVFASGDAADAGVAIRRAGLEFRDTILVVGPGPSSLFILLARKPVQEATVASNVLKYGTGGINVEASRISTEETLNGGAYSGQERRRDSYAASDREPGAKPLSRLQSGFTEYEQPSGRFPANLILVHGAGCRQKGTRDIRAHNATYRSGNTFGGDKPYKFDPATMVLGYAKDGVETVAAWECAPDCPILPLDRQSRDRGVHPAGSVTEGNVDNIRERGDPRLGMFGWGAGKPSGMRYGDEGAASRFFVQLADLEALIAWVGRLIGPPGLPMLIR